MTDPILSIRHLSKTYENKTKALKDVSFNIGKGEMVSIIGSSGAGKSTLLRCINKMIEPDEGSSIIFNNEDIMPKKKEKLTEVRKQIGMVFQHYNLVYRLTALENVLHGRLGYYSTLKGALALYDKEDIDRASELLEILGLGDRKYFKCSNLSGGQKQRVGIARALIQDPKIILCDEPIASLDPQASKVIMEYLKKINEEMGIPVVVNLHQVDVAIKYSDRIIGMSQGEILFDDTTDALNTESIERIYGAKINEILAKV